MLGNLSTKRDQLCLAYRQWQTGSIGKTRQEGIGSLRRNGEYRGRPTKLTGSAGGK